jgi:CRP-like cAMP-binding protein
MRFVGPLERALYLKTLSPLEGLGPAEIAVFAEHAVEHRYRRGAHVLKAGEMVPACHVVVEGRLRVQSPKDPQPTEVGPRETAGLLTLLARSTQGVDAIAVEDTLTLSIEADVVFDIMEDNFTIFLQLLRYVARRTLEERRDIPEWELLAPGQDDDNRTPENLNLIDRLLYLRRPGSVFEHSSLAALADLTAMTPELRFPPGTILWNAGDRSDEAFIIMRGIVLCTAQGTLTPFRCGPGYPMGNLERLYGEPRWYTAVTETDVVALRSDLDSFLDVLEDHPDIARDVLVGMARNLFRLLRTNSEARESHPSSVDGSAPPVAAEARAAHSGAGIPS